MNPEMWLQLNYNKLMRKDAGKNDIMMLWERGNAQLQSGWSGDGQLGMRVNQPQLGLIRVCVSPQ